MDLATPFNPPFDAKYGMQLALAAMMATESDGVTKNLPNNDEYSREHTERRVEGQMAHTLRGHVVVFCFPLLLFLLAKASFHFSTLTFVKGRE